MVLAEKLHPNKFTDMSPKMAAIVACILGESWAEPRLSHLSITSDGFIISDGAFLGAVEDLDRNLANLLDAAELTDNERKEFHAHYRSRVTDWRL